MRPFKITVEHILYGLVVLLAVGVRLAYLGSYPLSDPEASLALNVLHLLDRVPGDLGGEPGYAIATGILFFLFGPDNGIARFAPAVLGGLLAFIPYFYRRPLGQKAAILLAIGLALDPGLIALSRQAGGTMMGISLFLFALTAWFANRPILAGSLGALSLITGPIAMINALIFGGVFLIARALRLAPAGFSTPSPTMAETRWDPPRLALVSGGGTLLLAGTLFMLYPSGIGAMADVIPASINTLFRSRDVSLVRPLFALLIYQPLVMIFGTIGGIRAWMRKDDLGKFFTLWALLGLLVVLLTPGRQIWYLAWPLIPLMALAAQALGAEMEWDSDSGLVSLGLAAVITILLTFIWLQLASMARIGDVSQTRTLLILGVIFISGVSAGLVGLGWSWPVAQRGLTWGILIGLSIYGLSQSGKMVNPASPRAQELWYAQPSVIEEDLLLETLGDLSEWATGRRDALDVDVSVDMPSLRWALRDFADARYGGPQDRASMPSSLVTSLFDEPVQPAAYRGSDYLWRTDLGWEGAFPPNLLRWIVFRDSPTLDESIILWARNDLFPGGVINPDEELPAAPDSDEIP